MYEDQMSFWLPILYFTLVGAFFFVLGLAVSWWYKAQRELHEETKPEINYEILSDPDQNADNSDND